MTEGESKPDYSIREGEPEERVVNPYAARAAAIAGNDLETARRAATDEGAPDYVAESLKERATKVEDATVIDIQRSEAKIQNWAKEIIQKPDEDHALPDLSEYERQGLAQALGADDTSTSVMTNEGPGLVKYTIPCRFAPGVVRIINLNTSTNGIQETYGPNK